MSIDRWMDKEEVVCVCVCALSRVWLCSAMVCSPPGSSVRGIFQARMREWVAIPFSRDLLDPVIETASLGSSALAGRYFTTAPPTKPQRRCGTYILWNMGFPGGAVVKKLPAPGSRVRALLQEDPICRRAAFLRTMTMEPTCHNHWSLCVPKACALQQEKPPQWEACTPRERVTPACHN